MSDKENYQKVCELDDDSKKMLSMAIEKMGLSARGYYKILKVAITIAYLNGMDVVDKRAIQEAISYRKMDKFIK